MFWLMWSSIVHSFSWSKFMLCSGWRFLANAVFRLLLWLLILLFQSLTPLSSSCSLPLSLLTCCQNRLGSFLSASQHSTRTVHVASLYSCAICFSCCRNLLSYWNCHLLHPITSICWFNCCISFLMFIISVVFPGCGKVLYFVWGTASVRCCISFLMVSLISCVLFSLSSKFSHFDVCFWNIYQ